MNRRRHFPRFLTSLMLLAFCLSGAAQAREVPAVEEPARVAPSTYVQEVGEPNALWDWQIERIDHSDLFLGMEERSLALDAEGHPHVVYGGLRLFYAWHDGTTWHREVVDESAEVGANATLALDAAGLPYITYYDSTNNKIKYAHYDGAAWRIDVLGQGQRSSIVLDSAGLPHVAFGGVEHSETGFYSDPLMYASFDGSAWEVEAVGYERGTAPSLVLGPDGQPHVAFTYIYQLSAQLKYAHWDGVSWQVSSVGDVASWWSYSLSLVLGLDGQPHIAYLDRDPQSPDLFRVRYTFYDGAAWQFQVVESFAGNWPTSCVMVRDSAGDMHIGYDDPVTGELRHAWNAGGTWQIETIPLEQTDVLLAIAMDGADRLHFDYLGQDRSLRYAVDSGSGWQSELVDQEAGKLGQLSSLALDAAGYPDIGYVRFVEGQEAQYSYYDGVTQQTEIVDRGFWSIGVGLPRSTLALDHNGRPHLVYARWGDGVSAYDLVYAFYDGANWYTETVDVSTDRSAALALDGADEPHVGYFVWVPGMYWVQYAYRSEGVWHTSAVQPTWSCGSGCLDLVLDAAERPHLAYMPNGYLSYAFYDGLNWTTETVEMTNVADYVSLALDSAGRPHIAYTSEADPSSRVVRYTYFDGASWQIESVTHGGTALNPSMALDAHDSPHMVFSQGDDVIYAYRGETGWITQTVAGGSNPSLALDSAGRPHIAYSTNFQGDLMYASVSCAPLTGVAVDGPRQLSAGNEGLYSAAGLPITATEPIMTWDNGVVGANATYSWTLPGLYTVTVTATNGCSRLSATLAVSVFYQPMEGVAIEGLGAVLMGQEGTYLALAQPITASRPVTFTWSNGTVGASTVYSWTVTGTQVLTVTAANACGEVAGERQVRVLAEWPYGVYLPVVWRQ